MKRELLLLLSVFTGGGAGSTLRYLISKMVPEREPLPWATLAANSAASFIAGFLLAWFATGRLSNSVKIMLITGFCGGLSTFSTFMAENLELADQKSLIRAGVYFISTTIVTLAAHLTGYKLALFWFENSRA